MKKTVICLAVLASLLALALAAHARAECKVGSKAQVLWKGSWYPASVKKMKGDQAYIHYDGYNNSWDEWVSPERIKCTVAAAATAKPASFSEGDAVSIKWKGTWYDAHVIGVNKKKDSWKIHYDGYNSSWDEWVGADRIRTK
ncbi:MAG: hypothetical protein JXA24_06525 [Proteobacteria bacterium]|nr:hypothetical protein [Pseudomonadota bacterium]